MSTNRFNKPAKQPIMNTYAPLPFQELLMAGQAKQQQQNVAQSGVIDLGSKQFNYLNQDSETAREARTWLDDNTNKLSDMDLTTKEGKREMQMFLKEGKKRFGQDGDIGAMQSNFNAYKTWSERERKRIGKPASQGGITQDQFKRMSSAFISNYEGIGPKTLDGYSSLHTEDIASHVDMAKWADTYGKGFEARLKERAYSKTGGSYIQEGKSADEVLTPEEIQDVLLDYAKSDNGLQNYLKQGSKYGYSSPDQLMSAIMGASKKYDVNKHTETRSSKVDSYGLDAVKRQRDFQEKLNNETIYQTKLSLVDSDGEDWRTGILSNYNIKMEKLQSDIGLGINEAKNEIESAQTDMANLSNAWNSKTEYSPEEKQQYTRDMKALDQRIKQARNKQEVLQNKAVGIQNEYYLAKQQVLKAEGVPESGIDKMINLSTDYENLLKMNGSATRYLKNEGLTGKYLYHKETGISEKDKMDTYFDLSDKEQAEWDRKASAKYKEIKEAHTKLNSLMGNIKTQFAENRNNRSTSFSATPLTRESIELRPGAMQVENHIKSSTKATLNGTYSFTDVNGKTVDVTDKNYDFSEAIITEEIDMKGGGYSILVPEKSYYGVETGRTKKLYVTGTGVTNLEEVQSKDNMELWKKSGYNLSTPVAYRAIRSKNSDLSETIQETTSKLISSSTVGKQGAVRSNGTIPTPLGDYTITSKLGSANSYYLVDPTGKMSENAMSSDKLEEIILKQVYFTLDPEGQRILQFIQSK